MEESLLTTQASSENPSQNTLKQNIDQNSEENLKSLQKNSSFETISALVNQMLGGTMLVLPILFQKNGILGAMLTMTLSGAISCKTCLLFNLHFKSLKEQDYQQSVKRILGGNFELLYKVAKLCYLFFLLLIYYCLIVQQLYMMITFFLAQMEGGEKYYVPVFSDKQFVFNKFSLPYASIISFVICLILVFQKNLVLIVKIAGYGTISIFIFCGFIIYIFFANVFTERFKAAIEDQRLWSYDIGTLAGTASMAFQLHINACQSLRCNKNQSRNKIDLIWVYVISSVCYILIGLLGSLAITGNCIVDGQEVPLNDRGTINDCFNANDFLNLIIIVSYLFNLISSFPIYYNLLKDCIFDIFLQKGQTPTDKQVYALNIGYMIMCIIVQNIPGVEPDAIMGLNGAVCCFFFIYYIPIIMHIQCYHGKNKVMTVLKRSLSVARIVKKQNKCFDTECDGIFCDEQTFIDNEENIVEQLRSVSQVQGDLESEDAIISEDKILSRKISQRKMSLGDGKISRKQSCKSFESCNYHEDKEEGRFYSARIIFYGIIFMTGVSILFYEIYIVTASFF